MFSKACEYGIRAAIFIAKQSLDGKKVSLKETTEAIDSPEAYTSKILQQLKRNGIIHSDKGPRGGFSMNANELENTNLEKIVFIFDGNKIYEGCGLGLKQCSAERPCPLHHDFAVVRNTLARMLEKTTVKGLATEIQEGPAFLKT